MGKQSSKRFRITLGVEKKYGHNNSGGSAHVGRNFRIPEEIDFNSF
jgi:hypothetical protein